VELPVAGVDDIRVRDDFRVETVQLLVWSVEADANATERIALLDLQSNISNKNNTFLSGRPPLTYFKQMTGI
jgi:hypothetical protein